MTVNPMLDVDPLPCPEDLFTSLAGGMYFLTFDLSHMYNQLILDDNSCNYLTINTHQELYQYNRLPFGVASALSIFQKSNGHHSSRDGRRNLLFRRHYVSGKIEEEHLTNIGKVLQQLQEHGIRAKRAKCIFLKTSVQYLGHIIDANGLHAAEEKLDAIVHASESKNVHELRSFLGLLNYYGRFIPNLSSLLHLLNHLLQHNVTSQWTKACSKTLKCVKEKIVSPNVLVHYNSTWVIMNDISRDGL